MTAIPVTIAIGLSAVALTACSGTAQPTATVTVTEQPTSGSAPGSDAKPASGGMLTTFGEGIYTVGLDVKPGTYRVTAPAADKCYWAISKTGTNGEDLIRNDIPNGGFPTVTLIKGQDFSSHDCGTWALK